MIATTLFSPDLLSQLTALLNTHIALIPPTWTLTPGQIDTVLANPFWWNIHYPENATPSLGNEILCRLDGSQLTAAAQVMYGADGNAVIEWIAAQPDVPQALNTLLADITVRARQGGCHSLGMSRYAFGVGWLGVSLEWPHIIAGLQNFGFTLGKRWVLMSGPTDLPETAAPAGLPDLHLEWREKPDKFERRLEVYASDQLVGDCDAWEIPVSFAGCPGFSEWITIEWVGIERAYQQRGLGQWMFSQHLHWLARRGFQNVILWTETTNLPMQRLAEKLGFGRGPLCQEFAPLPIGCG